MRARIGGLCVGLATVLGSVAIAQPPATAPLPKPTALYGHDFRVRKPDVKDFDKNTPRVAVEFYLVPDPAGEAVVALSEKGNLAVTPAYPVGADKKTEWVSGFDVRARKASEENFASAPNYAVEAFRDIASGKLLYVSNPATVAIVDPPAGVKTDQDPAWYYGLNLNVRTAAGAATADRKKYGIEAYKDGVTGGLVYVTETGAIAAPGTPAPPTAPDPNRVKAPTSLHWIAPRVRKAGEGNFGSETRKVGIEVFRDENTGGLIYISETGSIAAVPAPAEVLTGKGMTWKHAMELKARPGGEPDFGKAAKFGLEVIQDNNTGYTVYVADTGAIAVLPKK